MPSFPQRKTKEILPSSEVVEAEQSALESMEAVEAELEQAEQQAEKPVEQVSEIVPVADAPITTPVAASVSVQQMDPLTAKIEHLLEDDLTDLYLKMTPSQQQIFKEKGEETASKIRLLLDQTKVNAKKIFDLLREWLKLIPGVNRFFLEQEAKIKTDQILFMNDQEKNM